MTSENDKMLPTRGIAAGHCPDTAVMGNQRDRQGLEYASRPLFGQSGQITFGKGCLSYPACHPGPIHLLITLLSWLVLISGAVNADALDLDSSFGSGGKVLTTLSVAGKGMAVTVQHDGKIVVAGSAGSDLLVARYDQNGEPDVDFGENGVVITRIGRAASANKVVQEADGKLLVVGGGVGTGIVVSRYDTDGTNLGFNRVPALGGYDVDGANAVEVLDDDRFLVVSEGYAHRCGVARFNSDLSLGDLAMLAPDLQYHCQGIAADPNGDFAITFNRENIGGFDDKSRGFAMAKFLSSGLRDTAFGNDGSALSLEGVYAYMNALHRLSTGLYLGAGGDYQAQTFLVGRFTADGLPDSDFGSSGAIKIPCGNGFSRCYANAVLTTTDGSIIAGGTGEYPGLAKDSPGGPGRWMIVRLTAGGVLDGKFGPAETKGVVINAFDAGSTSSYLTGLALQADGKLLAVGYTQIGGVNRIALARYVLGKLEEPGTGPGTGTVDCTTTEQVLQTLACGVDDLQQLVKTGEISKIRGKLGRSLKLAKSKFLLAERLRDKPKKQKAYKRAGTAGLKALLKFAKLYNSPTGQKRISSVTRQSIDASVTALNLKLQPLLDELQAGAGTENGQGGGKR